MKPAAPDDIRLISEIDAGSAEALAELYDRFCHRAYAVAFSTCRDEAAPRTPSNKPSCHSGRAPRAIAPSGARSPLGS
jgi:hypothetical protein